MKSRHEVWKEQEAQIAAFERDLDRAGKLIMSGGVESRHAANTAKAVRRPAVKAGVGVAPGPLTSMSTDAAAGHGRAVLTGKANATAATSGDRAGPRAASVAVSCTEGNRRDVCREDSRAASTGPFRRFLRWIAW